MNSFGIKTYYINANSEVTINNTHETQTGFDTETWDVITWVEFIGLVEL